MTLRRMTRAQNRQVQMKLHRDQGGLCPIRKLPINLAAAIHEQHDLDCLEEIGL